MASLQRKDKAAAQADTGPANAGGDDPAWAAYNASRRTQTEKLNDFLRPRLPARPTRCPCACA
eukprot:10357726-Alexandrium_andersonii.AAC.1